MSDAIQQAIEALRMTKYCIPAYGFHAEKVTIDEAIAGLQALQHSGEPVVPPQWRVVMRGMIEYAECNDPGNPYLDQAKALLSAGKGGGE